MSVWRSLNPIVAQVAPSPLLPTRSSPRCPGHRSLSARRPVISPRTPIWATISTSRAITRCKAHSYLMRSAVARMAHGFPPLAAGLVVLSWIALVIWETGPYGRYLHHGDWTAPGLGTAICAAVPGGSRLVSGVLYSSGWLLMSAAMMLPTA